MSDKSTAVERVQALEIEKLDNAQLGAALVELIDATDRVEIRLKDYNAASEMIRAEFLKRLVEQGAKSINLEGVGLLVRKETTRFSSKDWSKTYAWLWRKAQEVEATRAQTGEGDPAEVFSWLGKSIAAAQCKDMLEESGLLPDGVEKSTQTTLTFTRKDK